MHENQTASASQPLKIAVLHGGPSSEHAISIWSSTGVIATLRSAGHEVHPVFVDREGLWHFGGESTGAGEKSNNPVSLWQAIAVLADIAPAVCFMGFHGTFGEDGKIQAALEMMGLRFTGSGVTASAVAMDKPLARRVFAGVGIPVALAREVPCARLRDVTDARLVAEELSVALGLPVVVKVPAGGSSVGVEIPRTTGELTDSLQRLSAGEATLLCEQFIDGIELTAGVLANHDGQLESLPIVEIAPVRAGFFDYAAKYEKGGSDEIVPARISAEATAQVQALGLAAHRALGCRGVSRTDVILRHDGMPFVLETNTLPGLTPASLLPKAAAGAGYSYLELLQRIVAAALD